MDTIDQVMVNRANLRGAIERAGQQALREPVGAICVFGRNIAEIDRVPVWDYWVALVSPLEIHRYMDGCRIANGSVALFYATTQAAQRALLE